MAVMLVVEFTVKIKGAVRSTVRSSTVETPRKFTPEMARVVAEPHCDCRGVTPVTDGGPGGSASTKTLIPAGAVTPLGGVAADHPTYVRSLVQALPL